MGRLQARLVRGHIAVRFSLAAYPLKIGAGKAGGFPQCAAAKPRSLRLTLPNILLFIRGPIFSRNERTLVIDEHDRSHRQQSADLDRC